MLIPQEVHKPSFQIDGPIMQTAFVPVARVMAPKKGAGTKQHEEKSHKRKRKFRFLIEDEAELSEEAFEAEAEDDPEFRGLLNNFAAGYLE